MNKENLLTKNWAKLEHVVPAFSPVKGGGMGEYTTRHAQVPSDLPMKDTHTHTYL